MKSGHELARSRSLVPTIYGKGRVVNSLAHVVSRSTIPFILLFLLVKTILF